MSMTYSYGCSGNNQSQTSSTPAFKDAAELRNWIMQIEKNRVLSDLADVTYQTPPQEGDILTYNGETQQWELIYTDIILSGGSI